MLRRDMTEGSDVMAHQLAQDLRSGDLTLRQITGISDREMQAIAEAAESLRRQGDLGGAASVWVLLISYDPYIPHYWRALADLQRRLGAWTAAVTCYEMLALVQDREAESTYHEACCLRAMGEPALSRFLLREAISLTETDTKPAWTTAALRQLDHDGN